MLDSQQLQQLNANLPPVAHTMQARVVAGDKTKGWIEMNFHMGEEYCHALGLQGGLICAMLDNTMARVAHLVADELVYASTLELKTSFYRPGASGFFRTEAEIVRAGKSILFAKASLYDKKDQLIAQGTSTIKLIINRQPRSVEP